MIPVARLAWFSPMPPARTGIAIDSAQLVAALRGEHEVDVYVDEPLVAARRAAGSSPFVRSAHDFVWRHHLEPYDLTVFQVGNSSAHDYQWPYLFRYPGLVVLHDVHLHHARASALLRQHRADDYRAELAANHPDLNLEVAELAIAGFDSNLYFQWPMTRLITLASRTVAVHSPIIADELGRETGREVATIQLSHGTRVDERGVVEASRRVRERHDIPGDSVVFGVFGGLTPDKRVPQVISAFAALLPYAPTARLLLVGQPAAHGDVLAPLKDLGLQDHVVATGYVNDDGRFSEYVAGCDVSINLRWPSAREVSGPWLRALGAGKPTITIDLAHMAHVPAFDPRTWSVIEAPASPNRAPREGGPVTVGIDIVDEDHSLRLAMRRLATDPELRTRLGRAAAAYWEREHSMDRMLADYHRVLERAIRAPIPEVELPPHLRANASERLDQLLEPFGLDQDVWSTRRVE
jgi:glycosyltransferase involved in cell wall biosynthesis